MANRMADGAPLRMGFGKQGSTNQPLGIRIMAENPGFSSNGRETRRETDCLMEGR